MKFKKFIYIAAALPLLATPSCLDFDEPGAELVDSPYVDPNVPKGVPDKIDFSKTPTEEEFYAAIGELENDFGMLKSGSYYALGSKEGRVSDTHAYQYFCGMTTHPIAGYYINSQSWSGKLPSAGSYYYEYMDGPYGHLTSVKNQVAPLLNKDAANVIPELKACALLIYDIAAARCIDIYGAVPYKNHKENQETNPFTYDDPFDSYVAIVQNINDINDCFKNFETRPDWYKEIYNAISYDFDGITQDHSVESWRRLANSVKLRLAMHIVKFNSELAKQWAEEAVAEGVVETYDQESGAMIVTGQSTNPVKGLSVDWGDSRCSAQFYSLLSSLNHPMRDIWFDKNAGDITSKWTGEVTPKGTIIAAIRGGVGVPGTQGIATNHMFAYSTTRIDGVLEDGTIYRSQIAAAPVYMMKVSEVEFLRAEGALRGWNMGGDAQYWYEKGVRDMAIADRTLGAEDTHPWSEYVDEYMELEKAVPFTYHDPYDDENDDESPVTIGVKWNNSDTPEVKLEKIITQKYISMFPNDSSEAWTEMRRTGYPRLLPIINLDEYSDGSLHDGDIIRRIPFPGRGTQLGLDDINNSGIEALGGPDMQGTRVFWDVDAPNF